MSAMTGGVYKQLAPPAWAQQNAGLADIQLYSIAGHQGDVASSYTINGMAITPIVAGAQDNGTLLYLGYTNGGTPQPDDWVPIATGDGGVTQVDPADANNVYSEYVHLSLDYSSQGGADTQPYANEPPDSTNKAANFIAPYKLVPAGGAMATQMIAAGASVWLATNIQIPIPTWKAINASDMPTQTANSNYASAIAIDPSNGNDVWVGYDDGEVWHTNDALSGSPPSWTAQGVGVLPARPVESFWKVPGTSGTVYATFGGFPSGPAGGSNVWRTTDGGGTWTDVGVGLPPAPVYSLVTHPAYPQVLYAGTLTGVYTSVDGGQSWTGSGLGPANVEVRELSWFDVSNPDAPTLLAATFGRGAWLGSPAYYPTPTLSSSSPAEIPVGSASTLVTLTGSGFVRGVTTVTLDARALAATYQSATELQVTVPATTLSVVGPHTFVASNPLPGGGTSAGVNVSVGYPLPVLSSISPTSGTVGSAKVTISVAGRSFVPSSTVDWNGAALATTYDSATNLTATVPATDLASAATVQITVVSPQPGGGTSAAVAFAVHARGGGGGGLGHAALLLLLGANLWAFARTRVRGVSVQLGTGAQ